MKLPVVLRCPRCESEVRADVAHLPHDGVWPVGWQGYRTERGPCSWTWPRAEHLPPVVATIPPEVQAAMARGR